MPIVSDRAFPENALEATFGYETKFEREQCLGWEKSHAADAVAIACEEGESVNPSETVYRKRHVAKGDYQQTSGACSEKRIPTGKLFGLRKFDLIRTKKGTGYVKGTRSSGYFAIMDIDGKDMTASVDIRNNIMRLQARSTTLIARAQLLPALKDGVSAAGEIR